MSSLRMKMKLGGRSEAMAKVAERSEEKMRERISEVISV